MKQHEREYFVARIRSGIYKLDFGDMKLKIVAPTLEQDLEVQEVYINAYRQAEEDGFLQHEDMLESMKERGLWSDEEEERIKGLEKDIDKLKVELFQNKNREDLVKQIRTYLKAGKDQLNEELSKKMRNYENTCEGLSQVAKVNRLIKLTCLRCDTGEPYDFKEIPKDNVMKLYGMQVLSEASTRELARTEPWSSTWILRDTETFELFSNKEQLNADQKNLLVWARMYESVQESLDCPSDDVIEDDDMLDGWFILQKKKREQERVQSDIEQSTQNSKIANSDEIFIMADTQADAERINRSNTFHNQQVKKQRMSVIRGKGEAEDIDFQDQQLKLRQRTNEMFKGNFRR